MTAHTLCDRLVMNLNHEIELAGNLHKLISLEFQALKAKDTAQIADYNSQKNTLLAELDSLHGNTLSLICKLTGKSLQNFDPDSWLQNTEAEKHTLLPGLWQQLRDQLRSVRSANQRNGIVLNRMASTNRFLLRLLTGQPEQSVYGAGGRESGRESRGTLGKA